MAIRGLVAGLLLVSCAQATPISPGSGVRSYYIECNGELNRMSTCIKKANKVCPSGYRIDSSSQAGVQRTLVVTCR